MNVAKSHQKQPKGKPPQSERDAIAKLAEGIARYFEFDKYLNSLTMQQ